MRLRGAIERASLAYREGCPLVPHRLLV